MKYFIEVLSHCANFKLPLSRKGFWMFYLFYTLFLFLATILDSILGLNIGNQGEGAISTVYFLLFIIPVLSAMIRRLKDAGKHWAWVFIPSIPIIGTIILIIFLLLPTKNDLFRDSYF